MAAISDRQLYAEGMATDEIAGFRAIVARPRTPRGAEIGLAPEHFRGARLDAFERGASTGRLWHAIRNTGATARRRIRAEEIAATGACTPLDCMTAPGDVLRDLRMALGKRS